MKKPQDDEIAKIITAEKKRYREAQERIRKRLDKARSEAKRLASRFVEEQPSIKKVILFGSVAAGNVRNDWFDIDLGVIGGDSFELFMIAEDSEFKVDVVDLQSASPKFRELAESRGVVLYEQK
jgi:predicted nucleotidyltransferase